MLEMAKHCSTEYLTASRCLSSKPVFVFLAVVTPNAPEEGSIAYLRNGETSNSEILFNFQGQYSHPYMPVVFLSISIRVCTLKSLPIVRV